MAQQQIYKLPTMPFNREIANGLSIGSLIQVTGRPYMDKERKIQISLITNNNDVALRIIMELGMPSKIKIDCIVSQKPSTPIENQVTLYYERSSEVAIKTLQHSFQINYNGSKVADFVHRIDPTLIKKISIDGPLITEEVAISPNSVDLPSYEQATSPPTDLLRNMTIGASSSAPGPVPAKVAPPPTGGGVVFDFPPPPAHILNPPTAPTAPPMMAPTGMAPNPPQTGSTSGTTSSSFFYTGGSQGFSNHPYPLPGLIDNSTHASQPLDAGRLPQNSIPNVAMPQPNRGPIYSNQTTTTQSTPYVTTTTTGANNLYTPTPTANAPYTVTYPPSAASTPSAPPQQHMGPQQQQYPPQPGYPMPQPPMVAPQVVPQVTPQVVAPQPAYNPMAVAPQYPYPAAYPQVQVYPQTTIVPQPYVQPMMYPYAQAYPGVVYYENDYYGHHHHHHRHHHC